MAVTGEFLADFLDFIRGAKSAEDALDGLEKKGTDLGSSWEQAFAKGGNLEKFFDAPLKTSTGLVKDFVMEMGPMGAVALAGAAGVTAAGVALTGMANASANTADSLGDLSDKTGMSVPELSKLSNAATLAGTSVGALADVAFTMQTRMQKNPEEFARGLKTLSINAQEFAAAGSEQRVELFTRALAANSDAAERNAAGLDVVGKSYKELAPALIDLGNGALDAAAGLGHVFTEQDKKNAEAYHKELTIMKATIKGVADDIGTALVPALAGVAKEANSILKGFLDANATTSRYLAAALEQVGLKAADAGLSLEPIPDKFKAAYGPDRVHDLANMRDAIDVTTNAKIRDKEITKELADQEADRKKAADDQAKAALEWADAMYEIITAGEGSRDTVKSIDPETAAFATHLLEMGVSQKSVAAATDLSTHAVAALSDQLKDKNKTLEESAAIERRVADGLQKLWADYYTAVADGSADTTQKQIDNIWRQMNAESLALDTELKGNQQAMDLIVAKAQAKTDAVIKTTLAEDHQTRDYYERLADEAAAAYAFATEHSDHYTAARLSQLRTETEAANAALADWQYVAEAALTQVGDKAEATTAALVKTRDAVHDAFMPGTFTAPSTGLHEENRLGGRYLVNDQGQTVQALQAQYGASGFLGYGLPPGQTMQNVINLNGILLSNDPAARQQLSDVINRTLTDTAKSQGVRLGSGA